jgi:crossover junction endodeoxyribonuclease RusA
MVNGRMLIAASGRKYRESLGPMPRLGQAQVELSIMAYYPDQRRRDIDNLLKAPLDALTYAGLWEDDSQIQALSIRKAGYDKHHPRLEITVTVL